MLSSSPESNAAMSASSAALFAGGTFSSPAESRGRLKDGAMARIKRWSRVVQKL